MQIALIDFENKNYTKYENNDLFFPPISHNIGETNETLCLIKNMQNARKELFKKCGTHNIEEYNKKEINKIPYIFIFVDEIECLMGREEIDKLIDLITFARSTGIIVFAATINLDFIKRKVLCGKIKANFVNRISFPVSVKEESKLVIDEFGAEELDASKNEIIVSSSNKNEKIILAKI